MEINKQLKRTAKDSLIYVPAMVIPAIVGIVLIRVLTTLFTPQEYGYYQITLSTFGLIRVFSMIWLSVSVTRFYLKYKNEKREDVFFSTLVVCTLVGTIFVSAISFLINTVVFKSRIAPELYYFVNIAIVASIVNAFFEIFVMTFRAGLEPKKYSLFWVLFSVGKPIVGVCLILFFNFRVDGIFLGFLFVPLILDFVIFFKLNLMEKVRLLSVSKKLIKEFAKYGIPISFSFLSFWILSLSDRFLIEYYRTSSEVGFYSVGYTISEKTLNFIYMILMLAAYPIIVDNWEKYGNEQTQKLITELTRYYFFICTPILLVLMVLPEQVLLIFSNEKFISGAKVLPFIAAGWFFNGLTQYVLKGFELHKKSHKIALLAFIAGVTNIGLNIFLIPTYGFLGAGISASTAYFVYFLLAYLFVKKDMAYNPPFRSIGCVAVSLIVSGIIMKMLGGFSEFIWYYLFVVMPVGVLIFYVILVAIKEIRIDEVQKGWKFVTGLVRGVG